MGNRDGIFAMVSLALGAVALAGVLYSEEFATGAQIGFGSGAPAMVVASAASEAGK